MYIYRNNIYNIYIIYIHNIYTYWLKNTKDVKDWLILVKILVEVDSYELILWSDNTDYWLIPNNND